MSTDNYFNWLCSLVKIDEPDNTYFHLARILYDTSFYTINDFDLNRAEDGLDLREEYFSRTREREPVLPCNVLEMLIALSERMSDDLYDEENTMYDMTYCFWRMICNLNLDIYTDEIFEYMSFAEEDIRIKLEEFLSRRYDYSGKGGLFPLKNPKKDQRKVEIWYQMNAYLIENYRF